jgi:hypothetical protein
METPETHWALMAFEQESGGTQLAEYELPEVSVEKLRAALGLPADQEDPKLLYVYPINTQEQAARFSSLLGRNLRLSTYDYFLEAFATKKPASGRKPRVQRKVTVFQKDPVAATPVFEHELLQEPDAALRSRLGHPVDDLGYHRRWSIDGELAAGFTSLLSTPLKLAGPLKYFIEYWDPRKTRPMALAYLKGTDSKHPPVIARFPFHGATKPELRRILGLGPDNPLAGVYTVSTEKQAAGLRPFLEQPLDLSAHDYAVNYYFPVSPPAGT